MLILVSIFGKKANVAVLSVSQKQYSWDNLFVTKSFNKRIFSKFQYLKCCYISSNNAFMFLILEFSPNVPLDIIFQVIFIKIQQLMLSRVIGLL